MARDSTSESSSDESRDLANRHSASEEEEEEEVAEAPVVAIKEADGSDIDGGNVDNFPALLLPPGFKEEPEGSDRDGRNVDNCPAVLPGFSPMPRYKKPRIPPFPLIAIVTPVEPFVNILVGLVEG